MSEHILKMQARAAAAIGATNAASGSLLEALARHAANIHARATRSVKLNKKRLDDATEEADTNAKQLIAWAALLGHAAHSALNAAPPPVFAIQNLCNWLVLPVANLADVDLSLLHHVFSADFDASRTSISGQGLTAFDPADGPEARQQNAICIIPRDVDGNLAEWVTATDIRLELVSLGADTETTLMFDITSEQDGWRVVYLIGGQPENICINLYICETLVWKSSVRADTPLSVTRANAIRDKHDDATQADANDLVGIATAFPTDADVQFLVYNAMWKLAWGGKAEGVRKVLVAGGHRVAITALGAFSTNAGVLCMACLALFLIARKGGADAKAAIRAVDGVMDKLRQASDVITATGWDDTAAKVLAELG